jgi:DNA-binding transcriptional ArsR family regulator
MNEETALDAFAALSHPVRLAVFRRLAREAPDGVTAGRLATLAGAAPSSMTAHLGKLVAAGLVTRERRSREIWYALDMTAARDLVGFLTEDCCGGRPELCGARAPVCAETAS